MSPLIPKLWKHFVDNGVQMPAEIPADCSIMRVYPGVHQRDGGAWSWHLWSMEPKVGTILMRRGSQYAAGVVARAKKVSVYEDRRGDAELVVED